MCYSVVFSQPSIYIDGWLYGMRMTSVVCNVPVRLSNPVFTETEKPGNPEFFSKPKNRFLAACKPGFSVLNFDLQMSNYATILTQTACNVHDSMFLFVYI